MEVEVHEDPKSSSMLALVCADGSHYKGGTQIDRHAEVMKVEEKRTRECLKGSTDMGKLGAAGFDMINARWAAKNCIMIMMFCAVTVRAMLLRFKEGGFYVKEEGKLVAYKMMDGKASVVQDGREGGGDAKQFENETYAIIIRGLPYASDCIEFYSRLLVAHFGSLAKGVILNGHSSSAASRPTRPTARSPS